ncbi:MAG: 3'(2'),5'-bisphosphate nucleotidase CysQ [Rhodospirillaceae bacterium]|nr:3'(2'),5'-bisphosphate nucleotidase CysQ [Rhodospirillaceae bacterium]
MNTGELAALAPQIAAAARAAGERIMDYYGQALVARAKDDRSPVTDADDAAERIILPVLDDLLPGVPTVSEEAVSRDGAPEIGAAGAARRFWLVDPLDGTKEFISRNGEFTVNIALIVDAAPLLGVVHLPALGTTYIGIVGKGTTVETAEGQRRDITARVPPSAGVTVLASRSHGNDAALDAFLKDMRIADRINAGSSLKFCRVAEGMADIYPRLGRTMEWDTAAGQAVLAAAGGSVCRIDGTPLTYGKPGFENPHFVARGRKG